MQHAHTPFGEHLFPTRFDARVSKRFAGHAVARLFLDSVAIVGPKIAALRLRVERLVQLKGVKDLLLGWSRTPGAIWATNGITIATSWMAKFWSFF